MGKRMERASGVLGKQLNSAVGGHALLCRSETSAALSASSLPEPLLPPVCCRLQIREAGSQAVNEVEFHMKKWFKFFGVFAFLTVALMPLPSVNVHLSFG